MWEEEGLAPRLAALNVAADLSRARAACIMEGVRRSEGARRKVASREGLYRLPFA